MELIPQYFERRLACALICFQLLAGLPIVSAWMRLFGELCSCSVKSNFFFFSSCTVTVVSIPTGTEGGGQSVLKSKLPNP